VTVVHTFTRAVSLASVALGLSISAAACVGGDAPDDPYAMAGKGGSSSGGSGGSTTPQGGSGGSGALKAGAKDSHFPLVDGATWTYHHQYPQNPGKMPWDEIATMRSATFEDKPAFILEDEEDAQGERSSSTMVIDGTKVQRVYKEVKVAEQLAFKTSYDPGFLRYDEAWADSTGEAVQLEYDSLQICVMASSASKCAAGAMRMEKTTHSYKVLSKNVSITVAAGTFDTVQIERTNLGDPTIQGDDEVKHFWYAPGVGKVREEDKQDGATEELSTYKIP
jgi:hypothetical protein